MTGMVATAQQVVLPPPPTPAIIILHMDSLTPKVRPFVTDFTTHLRGSGMDVVVQSLSSSARDNLHEKTVVLLLDADPGQKDLASIKEPEWEALKQTLLNCSDAVWITRGTNIYGENPWASMAQGLVRSLRAENPATVITMVDVACGTELHSPTTISSISRLMLAGRQAKHTRESHDWEYCIQGRDILIPRVMTEDAVNDAVFRPVKSETEQTPFGLPGTSLKIASIEPLRFVEDPAYCLGSLAKDEVEITVRAAHLVSSQGRTNNIHGLVTVSGNVTQLGTAAPCEWSVGDRVMTLQRGAIRNLYRCPLALCQKIPEKLGDFGAAVRILWAYTVAFYSLVHKASLRAGEVVLIHCTSNALEEAFINLAQHAGAEVFLLVSSEARKNQLASTFSIPRDHILLTGSAGTILHLEGLTMGRLFDVILLHPASVNLLQQASQYLAPGARLALVQRSPQGRTQHPSFQGSYGSTDKHEPWFPETKSTRLQLPIPGGTCVYIIEPHTLSHEDLTIIAQILKQATEFVQSSESHLDTGGAESFCRSEECFHITNRVEGAANHLLVESHGDTLVPVCPSI
jgi:NADPH:quinone reductase-like Zn-dependent oxidoreductase